MVAMAQGDESASLSSRELHHPRTHALSLRTSPFAGALLAQKHPKRQEISCLLNLPPLQEERKKEKSSSLFFKL